MIYSNDLHFEHTGYCHGAPVFYNTRAFHLICCKTNHVGNGKFLINEATLCQPVKKKSTDKATKDKMITVGQLTIIKDAENLSLTNEVYGK